MSLAVWQYTNILLCYDKKLSPKDLLNNYVSKQQQRNDRKLKKKND